MTNQDDDQKRWQEAADVATNSAESEAEAQPSPSKIATASNNLREVFGSGLGRIFLIAAVLIVALFIALALRGFNKKTPINQATEGATMDTAHVPEAVPNNDPVTPAEAQRRALQAQIEAEEAEASGKTYQPGFDTNVIGTENPDLSAGYFPDGTPKPTTTSTAIEVPSNDPYAQQRAAQAQQAHAQALAARDAYIQQIKSNTLTDIAEFSTALKSKKSAHSFAFAPTTNATLANQSTGAQSSNPSPSTDETIGSYVFRAGERLYATLDAEVNTDDSNIVMATIRGGPWNGSRLLGNIQQGTRNISLIFQTLVPKDGSATIKINALALRTEDSKVGMAEDIDHHILERYGALAVASLLEGYGDAFSQPIGTTTYAGGVGGPVTTTRTRPNDEEIVGRAVGRMGNRMSSSLQPNINRPTTYSTPAGQSFVLYFLQDVTIKDKG